MANKPAKAAGAPVHPKKHSVKASGVRIRSKEDARGFFSEKGTPPLNDTYNEKGELVKGLSEEEKIAAGYLKPRQRTPSFKKNPYIRDKWREVHTNAPHEGRWAPPAGKKRELKGTLIAHFINDGTADFRSTRSFKDVKASEIIGVLRVSARLTLDSNPYMAVTKFYHLGKTYLVENGRVTRK